jgi:hypothetical protein
VKPLSTDSSAIQSDGAPWLSIDSLRELFAQEDKILARIRDTPNGPLLFLTNPLLALQDLGVKLSDAALAELKAYEPNLAQILPAAYLALKSSRVAQKSNLELRGLFRKR